MTLLAVVPARGGSKGVPGKNIKSLGGRPLIAWTIDAAKRAKCIDHLIVSTDDDEIATVAKAYGAEVPFMRPSDLATDDTPGIAPILHALEQIKEFDWVVVLQPTSPLRTPEDIDGIYDFCRKRDAHSAVAVCEVSEHPYWMYRLNEVGQLQPIVSEQMNISRRQDLPKVLTLNGALYLARIDWLRRNETFLTAETVGFEMPRSRSLDLDTPEDWSLAELLIKN